MSAARDLLTLLADAYNRHDLDGIRALYAPGARVNDTALDAALATHERFFSFLPDVKAELRAAAADDTVVIAELTLHGTNTGPLPLGPVYRTIVGTDADVVPPTGRTVAVPVVLVIEEDGGRIVTERQHLDSLTLLAQLGPAADSLNAGRRVRIRRPPSPGRRTRDMDPRPALPSNCPRTEGEQAWTG